MTPRTDPHPGGRPAPPKRQRPLAFIQVDVDSLWAVREAYGMGEGESGRPPEADPERSATADPIWNEAIPLFLELFAQHQVQATFFVIGRDALVPAHRRRMEEILAAGHEVANHSHDHRLELALLPGSEIRADIERAQEAIGEAIGQRPVGFRSPGYGVTEGLIEQVRSLGIRYDSSLLPTPWGFAMRAIASRLTVTGGVRPTQYGALRHGAAPRRPYRPLPGALCRPSDSPSGLVEIPVSVCPFLRLPFHAGISMRLGINYFSTCLTLHRWLTPRMNFLFHGIDLLGCDEGSFTSSGAERLLFGKPLTARRAMADQMLRAILADHEIIRADQAVAREKVI